MNRETRLFIWSFFVIVCSIVGLIFFVADATNWNVKAYEWVGLPFWIFSLIFSGNDLRKTIYEK